MKYSLILFAVFIFSGCVKYKDIVSPAGSCKIDYIVYRENANSVYTGKFTYNKWGDPESIIIDKEYTGAPSAYFQYNKNRQLTAYLATYGVIPNGGRQDTSFARLTQYIYKNGIIVGDTTFFMSYLSAKYDNGYSVGEYKYDSWGRIIEYKATYWDSELGSNIYYYSYPNENPYINNTNVVGTHPILMFVNRDYNRQNRNVLKTNDKGLPTEFIVSKGEIYDGGYYFFPMPFHEVYYQCESKKGKR